MQKPLSESLQKLRRAQRALVHRKRRSRTHVSFTHSSGSRNLGGATKARTATATETAERLSRQSRHDETRDIPLAVVVNVPAKNDTWEEVDIRNTVKHSKDNGPYPPFIKHDASFSQEDSRCLGSPSRRRRAPPPSKTDFRDEARQSVRRLAEHRPYWGELPRSPIPSPQKPGAMNIQHQRAAAGYIRPNGPFIEKPRFNDAVPEAQFTIRRRPVPSGPAPARYSVFPRPASRQRPPSVEQPTLANPVNSESVRRSLSQQQQLSSLLPCESQPPLSQPVGDILSPAEGNFQSRSFSQTRMLNKFTRELQDFAKVKAIAGQVPVSTPTVSEAQTHVSVRTVQELLPYWQQFQAAGLAVTSADQKAPQTRKRIPPRKDSSGDGRLRFDGALDSGQGSSSSNRESSNDTVIHFQEPNPLSLALASDVPRKKAKERADKQSPPTERKVAKSRPSAMFLANKPLPAEPNSAQQSGSEEVGSK
ncbi:hypothetical protein B0T17DRAFT_208954 [Bombardia bombarda]|uniref:Uncharacterized protein n=1 Tax=Bombardia bombarda TaxID=252184 RepID=A0AA39XAV6_9PEZI|nr:hypothetical protein B0T17DRAFT_208954 [Bombardia bombarda]